MSRFWLTAILSLPALVIAGAIAVWFVTAERATPPPTESSVVAGARARLVVRLARAERIAEAREEARSLMSAEPAFRARRWVEGTYLGVRREAEREEDIALLVRVGVPER